MSETSTCLGGSRLAASVCCHVSPCSMAWHGIVQFHRLSHDKNMCMPLRQCAGYAFAHHILQVLHTAQRTLAGLLYAPASCTCVDSKHKPCNCLSMFMLSTVIPAFQALLSTCSCCTCIEAKNIYPGLDNENIQGEVAVSTSPVDVLHAIMICLAMRVCVASHLLEYPPLPLLPKSTPTITNLLKCHTCS